MRKLIKILIIIAIVIFELILLAAGYFLHWGIFLWPNAIFATILALLLILYLFYQKLTNKDIIKQTFAEQTDEKELVDAAIKFAKKKIEIEYDDYVDDFTARTEWIGKSGKNQKDKIFIFHGKGEFRPDIIYYFLMNLFDTQSIAIGKNFKEEELPHIMETLAREHQQKEHTRVIRSKDNFGADKTEIYTTKETDEERENREEVERIEEANKVG